MVYSGCVSGPHDLLTFVIFGMMAEVIKLKAARKNIFWLSISAFLLEIFSSEIHIVTKEPSVLPPLIPDADSWPFLPI